VDGLSRLNILKASRPEQQELLIERGRGMLTILFLPARLSVLFLQVQLRGLPALRDVHASLRLLSTLIGSRCRLCSPETIS
jgi:hypothetical protein